MISIITFERINYVTSYVCVDDRLYIEFTISYNKISIYLQMYMYLSKYELKPSSVSVLRVFS